MTNRATEDHKLWLFDLAHGNLLEDQIIKGFIKYYALNGFTIESVQDDLVFRTNFGYLHAGEAMESLKTSLEKFTEV